MFSALLSSSSSAVPIVHFLRARKQKNSNFEGGNTSSLHVCSPSCLSISVWRLLLKRQSSLSLFSGVSWKLRRAGRGHSICVSRRNYAVGNGIQRPSSCMEGSAIWSWQAVVEIALVCPEDGGSSLLRNVGVYQPYGQLTRLHILEDLCF
jgi:hypothetical protein